ncbi:MAG: hypothetical protein KBH99_09230, partial [Syntrophobacteraceae bacterium]|nr:hypothetical protein [Syntrophobacteraceae bacterium]
MFNRSMCDPVVDGFQDIEMGVAILERPNDFPGFSGVTLDKTMRKNASEEVGSPGATPFAEKI